MMFVSGIVGYILDKNGFPTAPMLLAFVLAPMLEENMRKAFIASQGSLVVFTASFSCSVAMRLPRREPYSVLPTYSNSVSIIAPYRLAVRYSRKSADTR